MKETMMHKETDNNYWLRKNVMEDKSEVEYNKM